MKVLKKAVLYLILYILCVIFIIPLLYSLYNSLLPMEYVDKWAPAEVMSLNNFTTLFTKYNVGKWLINTVVMTMIIVLGNLIFPVMAGYALARFKFPGKRLFLFIVVATMMVPFQLVIMPMYISIVNIGWNNTMASVTVPYLCQCVYVFFMREYYITIPNELEEAARMDGLSHAGVFARIILPVSKSAITPVFILCFTGTWNSYFVPATFITDEKLYPLVVGLNTVKARYFARPNLSMAGVVLLTIPVLIIYGVFQRWFIQGIAAYGIKA